MEPINIIEVNAMGLPTLHQFQEQVSELLLRHRSLLDVLSKYHQSNAAVNRSIVKSMTECGCIQVHTSKQPYTSEMTLEEAKSALETHKDGDLCEQCLEIVKSEMGKNLFYLSALCNVLNIDLETIVEEESRKCSTLGLFKMS
jgi:NTP pyrophosphatase (non-canonical NTP hydrolase)